MTHKKNSSLVGYRCRQKCVREAEIVEHEIRVKFGDKIYFCFNLFFFSQIFVTRFQNFTINVFLHYYENEFFKINCVNKNNSIKSDFFYIF